MPEKRLAPRRCKGKACKQQTRHESHFCAKCRYDAEMDKTEVRYEVAVAKTARPSLESMAAPLDVSRNEVSGGE